MPRAKKAPVAPYNTGNNAKIPDAPPGRAYGARAATEAAVAASPLATPSAPTVEPAPPDNAAMLAAAQAYQPTGPGLTDPSQNPGEPVTAGLPTGPGAGPEALNLPDPNQLDVQTWRSYLPTLEYLAGQPNSTASTRNFVRRLRAAMPPSTLA